MTIAERLSGFALFDGLTAAQGAAVADAARDVDFASGARLFEEGQPASGCPSAPGRIHRSTLGSAAPAASTHGLGVPDAVRLAEALNRAPQRLVVFAVEAADVGFGLGLSPAVAASLPDLIRAVLAELGLDPSVALRPEDPPVNAR